MWRRDEVAWFAGLFEGEGCITANNGRWRLVVVMTDFDVVMRADAIFPGVGNYYERPPDRPHGKPQLAWHVTEATHVVAVLAAIWPWLGRRRRERASVALAAFKRRTKHAPLLSGERASILADCRTTGDPDGAVARRHGVSRTCVQAVRVHADRSATRAVFSARV